MKSRTYEMITVLIKNMSIARGVINHIRRSKPTKRFDVRIALNREAEDKPASQSDPERVLRWVLS